MSVDFLWTPADFTALDDIAPKKLPGWYVYRHVFLELVLRQIKAVLGFIFFAELAVLLVNTLH